MNASPSPWPVYLGLALLIAAVIVLPFKLVIVLIVGGALLSAAAYRAWRRGLRRKFLAQYAREGKDLLLVYSNSPHWQEYIERRWLPVVGARAVVLNWSERASWDARHPLESAIARAWGGDREFNPLAVVIQPDLPIRVVRFWQAFRDFKHGKDSALRRAERELGGMLGVELPG